MPGPRAARPARFDWDDLGRYKQVGRFLDGYPSDVRTFYSPVDDVHGLLVALLSSTQKSIVLNMYGYDDEELNDIIPRQARRRARLRTDEPRQVRGRRGP